MDPETWLAICNQVTNEMHEHTLSHITRLTASSDILPSRLMGSGAYAEIEGRKVLMTCEHVACEEPLEFRFYGDDTNHSTMDYAFNANAELDFATCLAPDAVWQRVAHQAVAIPTGRFARNHQPVADEIFFFRGFAGENTEHLGDGTLLTHSTGYASQERHGALPSSSHFTMLWDPTNTTFASNA